MRLKKIFMSLLIVSALGLINLSCNDSESERPQTEIIKGNLVMVGGGPRPESVMRHIVSLSPDSTFLLIPMASSIPDTIGWEQRDQLLGFGAKQVEILMLTEEDYDHPDIIKKLKNATGIWFSGGDQNRLMEYFSQEMRNAVREAWVNGAVIAGTSAGTAVQSHTMITGDEQYPLTRRFDAFSQIRTDNVITSEGFRLLEGMIADQHFIKRNRLNRLINVLVDSEKDVAAAGIDEATALWLDGSGKATILGESQVILLEKATHHKHGTFDGLTGAKNIHLHILPPGSTFYWQNRKIKNIMLPQSEN
jgi:cyanophycinase